MKPLNNFSVGFQTHASRIGTFQTDVCTLLTIIILEYNFIDRIIYCDPQMISLSLTIKIEITRSVMMNLVWVLQHECCCVGELQDDVTGTAIESRFFRSVRAFYETSASKIIEKFFF